LAVGTETDGSIIMPAARAGLYALKLTPGSVDIAGLQPGSPGFVCLGPMAKTTADVATLAAIMQRHGPEKYLPLLSKSWAGLRLGFVDPALWRSYPSAIEPVDGFFEQTDAAMVAAQEKIRSLGGKVVKSIPLASWDDITGAMPDCEEIEDLWRECTSLPGRAFCIADGFLAFATKRDSPAFLQSFEGPAPQTLEELIEWNDAHADIEFTDREFMPSFLPL
jgi:amidase